MGKKIATCSYCGTRAILVLDAARHELTCSACGAPLHDMKFMPQAAEKKPQKAQKSRGYGMGSPAGGVETLDRPNWAHNGKKSKKKKKKKPIFRRVLEDIFDEIEDIFD